MQKIVFYDSDCMFCSRQIQVLHNLSKHDKNLFFASLKSQAANRLNSSDRKQTDYLILWTPHGTYRGAEAVVFLVESYHTSRLLKLFIKLIPRAILKFGYKFLAKHRHKLNSKQCHFDSELQDRVLK